MVRTCGTERGHITRINIPDHTELIELGAKKTRQKPPEWSAPVSLKSTRTVAA
jgi:hypothetical protein